MSRKRKVQKKRRFGIRFMPLLSILLLGLISLLFYAIYLDFEVRKKFEGARWEVPSRVYARPLDLFVGKPLTKADFILELKQLRFKNSLIDSPGNYYTRSSSVYFYSRPFKFPEEATSATRVRVDFDRNIIHKIVNLDTRNVIDLWRLEPVFIGGIYPKLVEDRVLVKLEEVPKALVDTLLAVEDRKFYEHYGVAPFSIIRALVANIRAGSRVQGGSTLTQQLVKNFYLSSEKTIQRKLNEAIMALLLEMHYTKDEILEAYLNEVYLGQDGRRAIHGFGLASQFYFDTAIENLKPKQIALLVGLVKGASYYDPRRFPERALKRRQLVQTLQYKQAIISENQYESQLKSPMGVSKNKPSGVSPYPYFLDLVKRQLIRDYKPEDLQTAGLRLFTSLDPITQYKTEKSITKRLKILERDARLPQNKLEVGAIITDPGTGLVRTLIGGRKFRGSGFNRALDASRQIGSLIKPIVYLTALQQDKDYRLNTLIPDDPISIDLETGESWVPENYDKIYHGDVSLSAALASSFNAATVRLGLNVGLDKVIKNAHRLGIESDIQSYPAVLLGATQFSLYEITQAYQTIASQGFKTPLRAINTVATDTGEVLSRYPLTVQQAVNPEHAYLILNAMQSVMTEGTGRKIYKDFPSSFKVAGKTGTSNDYRDSWFAGITGDKLAIIWVGADDNSSIGLSGGTGALKVWKDVMLQTKTQSLSLVAPENIDFVNSSLVMHQSGEKVCLENQVMPIVSGVIPSESERIVCTND